MITAFLLCFVAMFLAICALCFTMICILLPIIIVIKFVEWLANRHPRDEE